MEVTSFVDSPSADVEQYKIEPNNPNSGFYNYGECFHSGVPDKQWIPYCVPFSPSFDFVIY